MLLIRGLLCGALALLGGCTLLFGDDDAEPCEVDPAAVELVFADDLGVIHDLGDGAALPLVAAPQGGHIVLVAPRLRSARACQLQVNAALRDPASSRVVGLEERPITLHPRSDGWATPPDPAGLSDLANVAVCPSAVTTAIDGGLFAIELKLLDGSGVAIADASAMVHPTCGTDYCRSDCGEPFAR